MRMQPVICLAQLTQDYLLIEHPVQRVVNKIRQCGKHLGFGDFNYNRRAYSIHKIYLISLDFTFRKSTNLVYECA